MLYFWWIAGLVLGAVWVSRVLDAAIGMPSVANIARPEWGLRPPALPRVTLVVPARNEEAHIEQALTSMLRLDYPDFEIIAVDDRSTDRTGEIMERLAQSPSLGSAISNSYSKTPEMFHVEHSARLQVMHVSDLPSGWLGKTHAMWKAAAQATGEWILFTDADVSFRPDSLRRAVAYAEHVGADHLVLFPRVIMRCFGERMMLSFFNILFVFGHRPWKVANPRARDHMGVGAFNLVRRRVYEAAGTHRALRLAVVDDMKLGQIIKENGYAQRNVHGDDLISLRWARGALGVIENLSKNLFAVMLYRWPRTLGACCALLFLNLMPFVGLWLAPGWARAEYGVALLSIFLLYVGISWHAPISPLYFFTHPISSVLFGYILLRSMVATLWRGGVVWRGTKYPLDELRRNLV